MALREPTEASVKLQPKQEEAILALLSYRTVEDAARACKKHPRTLYRWLKEPDFRAEYQRVRWVAYSQSIARLQQASSAAVSTLLRVMVDPAASPSAKIGAAKAVLDQSAKGMELEELENRLAAIEKVTLNWGK